MEDESRDSIDAELGGGSFGSVASIFKGDFM